MAQAPFSVANSGYMNPQNSNPPEKQVEDTGLSEKFAAGLVYPQDTATMKRTEHYVQFFINQQDNARIKWYLEGDGNIYYAPELVVNKDEINFDKLLNIRTNHYNRNV